MHAESHERFQIFSFSPKPGWAEVWHSLWPMVAFTIVVMAFGARRFRRTLD